MKLAPALAPGHLMSLRVSQNAFASARFLVPSMDGMDRCKLEKASESQSACDGARDKVDPLAIIGCENSATTEQASPSSRRRLARALPWSMKFGSILSTLPFRCAGRLARPIVP